jgi:Spy/CpxP family protein refolding chaperone
MNIHNDKHAGDAAATATSTSAATTAAPRSGRRWLIAAALAVAAAAAGSTFASGGPGLPGHFGHRAHIPADPAAMAAHVDKMVDKFAADASPYQKARLSAIARSALTDLGPVHAQFRQAHVRAHELLMAPAVDRAALEQLRAEQMQRMDLISRRILVAVEDAAEVLTPEQRARFAEHLHSHMH